MQLQLKKNRTEKPQWFAQDFHPRCRNSHKTVWVFCCLVLFFFFFLTMDFCLLNCLFWYDLKFRPKMFTKEKQLNNSNLAKAISNWKLFLWSILDTAYVKWVHHLHPALKFWHNWNQSNLENIAGKNIVLLTPEKGLHWRKGQKRVIHIIQRKRQKLQELALVSLAKWKLKGKDQQVKTK